MRRTSESGIVLPLKRSPPNTPTDRYKRIIPTTHHSQKKETITWLWPINLRILLPLTCLTKESAKRNLQPSRQRQNLMHQENDMDHRVTNQHCHRYGSISYQANKKSSSSSHIRVGYAYQLHKHVLAMPKKEKEKTKHTSTYSVAYRTGQTKIVSIHVLIMDGQETVSIQVGHKFYDDLEIGCFFLLYFSFFFMTEDPHGIYHAGLILEALASREGSLIQDLGDQTQVLTT